MGIPVIGCSCAVCQSDNPRNQRLRCSLLIEVEGKKLLVDTPPDLREQALRYQINDIDGVILTHMHYDHIAGIDDLRVFNYRFEKNIPLMMHKESFANFENRYDYLLKKPIEGINQIAKFDFQVVDGHVGDVTFLGNPIRYFCYSQANMHVMGFRTENFAYVTDIRDYDESLFDELHDLETLVVSALRISDSTVHFNVEEAVQFAQRVGAKQTYFVHMAHEIEHETVNQALPKGINLAYDGMTI